MTKGGEPTTVVVVDDHAGFRTMAAVLLSAGGFRIAGEASTGAEALAMITALVPDVVLLDVQLPDTDGFAVLRSLRQQGIASRVVLCSVRAATDYGARLDACGATGFLTKSALTAERLRIMLGAG
ncbi:response regulator transcription factor [Plantactinospora alkalitolerans]|uniref:response regulator transcription factor n=1 Tax=Plantactinospora alkalitolerans TaxID=2789879 RepID=UPI002B21A2F6|nr:response regulator transcription factor [Plantactinospora alkalitolerans]